MRSMIAALALLAAWAEPAAACKCSKPPLGSALAHAKLAFVGTITEEIETKHCNPKHPQWCSSTFEYVVTVERVFKGKLDTTTVTMDSGSATGDCSQGRLGKVTGQRWLFLTNGALAIRMCTGTQRATGSVMSTVTKRLAQ